jgi:hypothetical protein
MRYVDAFNHFFPKRYFEKMLELTGDHKDIGKRGTARGDFGAASACVGVRSSGHCGRLA